MIASRAVRAPEQKVAATSPLEWPRMQSGRMFHESRRFTIPICDAHCRGCDISASWMRLISTGFKTSSKTGQQIRTTNNKTIKPSIFHSGESGSVERYELSLAMVSRNEGKSSYSCRPISGHCAPWPVKANTIFGRPLLRTGGLV